MANKLNGREELPEQVDKMVKDFMNEVYLYCEENNLPRGSVKANVVEDEMVLEISNELEDSHKSNLEKMMEEFEQEILALHSETEQ